MGETRITYQLATMVAELAETTRRQQLDLLKWTTTQLQPLSAAMFTGAMNWHKDRGEVGARVAAVFLDLLFGQLSAREYDEPVSALGNRVARDLADNLIVTPCRRPTWTGRASDLITAAWHDLSGIDYAATTFVLSRHGQQPCLILRTHDGLTGTTRPLNTALIARRCRWAYLSASALIDRFSIRESRRIAANSSTFDFAAMTGPPPTRSNPIIPWQTGWGQNSFPEPHYRATVGPELAPRPGDRAVIIAG